MEELFQKPPVDELIPADAEEREALRQVQGWFARRTPLPEKIVTCNTAGETGKAFSRVH